MNRDDIKRLINRDRTSSEDTCLRTLFESAINDSCSPSVARELLGNNSTDLRALGLFTSAMRTSTCDAKIKLAFAIELLTIAGDDAWDCRYHCMVCVSELFRTDPNIPGATDALLTILDLTMGDIEVDVLSRDHAAWFLHLVARSRELTTSQKQRSLKIIHQLHGVVERISSRLVTKEETNANSKKGRRLDPLEASSLSYLCEELQRLEQVAMS